MWAQTNISQGQSVCRDILSALRFACHAAYRRLTFLLFIFHYCNAVCTGRFKNRSGSCRWFRVLTKTRRVDHIPHRLTSLHSLPVCQRIDLKNNWWFLKCWMVQVLRVQTSQVVRLKTKHGRAAFSFYSPRFWDLLRSFISGFKTFSAHHHILLTRVKFYLSASFIALSFFSRCLLPYVFCEALWTASSK